MITFKNTEESKPFKKFKELYTKAIELKQENIEAVLISSFSIKDNTVDARYVNIKSINKNKFIFYTNYESPKAEQFNNHRQISAVFFWPKINVQIRIKANIKKVSKNISDDHFQNRSLQKNALAISSNQSKDIDSYNSVIKNYEYALKNANLEKRPKYWGGYCFTPYYFEFWKGDDRRINKREVYEFFKSSWRQKIIQP